MTWNVVVYARTKRHVFVARGLYVTVAAAAGGDGRTRTSELSSSCLSGGDGDDVAMPGS